jgi:hypothetical protein
VGGYSLPLHLLQGLPLSGMTQRLVSYWGVAQGFRSLLAVMSCELMVRWLSKYSCVPQGGGWVRLILTFVTLRLVNSYSQYECTTLVGGWVTLVCDAGGWLSTVICV